MSHKELLARNRSPGEFSRTVSKAVRNYASLLELTKAALTDARSHDAGLSARRRAPRAAGREGGAGGATPSPIAIAKLALCKKPGPLPEHSASTAGMEL